MIRRRGENISSFELEAAVLSYPQVREVAAVGIPSPFGDEEVLVAVVTKPGTHIDAAEMAAYLERIAPRFAIPRYVRFMEALPKTAATQRVQKSIIRAQGVTDDTWDRLLANDPSNRPQGS
jgi:crotonobetaine/carnitine-CoA ligase